MKTLRTVGDLCSLCALLGTLLTVILGLQIGLVPHTVDNGRAIEGSFSASASFVDGFVKRKGRLPSPEEFNHWKALQPERALGVRNVRLTTTAQIPDVVLERFGSADAKSYALELWRGEWSEYYASWVERSTVDSAAGLYASAAGLFLASLVGTSLFWHLARGARRAARAGHSAAV